jgi:hypothetical protein
MGGWGAQLRPRCRLERGALPPRTRSVVRSLAAAALCCEWTRRVCERGGVDQRRNVPRLVLDAVGDDARVRAAAKMTKTRTGEQ